ncbi:glycosyltransferase family 39 protein [bacterium]|nr:glycosyltransferase family 39 protein [bacterium]
MDRIIMGIFKPVNSFIFSHKPLKADKYFLLAVLFVNVAIRLSLIDYFTFFTNFDDIVKYQIATNWLDGNGALFNVFKPPVFPFLLAVMLKITDIPILAAKIPAIIFGSAVFIPAYAILKKLLNRPAAILFVVLLTFDPILIEYSIQNGESTVFAFLFFLSLMFTVMSLDCRKGVLLIFFSGIASSLAYMTRVEGFFLLFIIPIFIFLTKGLGKVSLKRYLPVVLLYMLIFTIFSLPYINFLHKKTGRWTLSGKTHALRRFFKDSTYTETLYEYDDDQNISKMHLMHNRRELTLSDVKNLSLRYINNLSQMFGWVIPKLFNNNILKILLLIFGFLIIIYKKSPLLKLLTPVMLFTMTIPFFVPWKSLATRYLIYLLPLIAGIQAYVIFLLSERSKLISVITMAVFLLFSLFNIPPKANNFEYYLKLGMMAKNIGLDIRSNIPEHSKIMAFPPEIIFYAEGEEVTYVHGMDIDDLKRYLMKTNPDYLLFNRANTGWWLVNEKLDFLDRENDETDFLTYMGKYSADNLDTWFDLPSYKKIRNSKEIIRDLLKEFELSFTLYKVNKGKLFTEGDAILSELPDSIEDTTLDFEGKVLFRGFKHSYNDSNGMFDFDFYWEPKEVIDRAFSIMVHIEMDYNEKAYRYNIDHEPHMDFLSNQIISGRGFIRENLAFIFPKDAPKGKYKVVIGIFNKERSGPESRLRIMKDGTFSIEETVGIINNR